MKKLFIILNILFFSVSTCLADINTSKSTMHFDKVNKKVLKYVQKANNAKTFEEKEKNFLIATKYLKDKKTDDIILKASIYYLIADNAKMNRNFDEALKWYKFSYSYLDKQNKLQNNYLAFGCMMNILNISKKTSNKDLYKETLLKIEETQLGLNEERKEEFRPVYGYLFEYYNNLNSPKAKEYEEIIKSYGLEN